MRKTTNYGELTDYSALGGMDFGAAPGVPEATFGNLKGELNNGSTTIKIGKGAALGAKPVLPQANIFTKYDQYSKLYEFDVSFTINRDINEMKDKKK